MEEKKKIGVDIDDVTVEFWEGYLKPFNKKFGKQLIFQDITTYKIWELTNVSKDEVLPLVIEFHNSEHSGNVKVIDGAKEALEGINKRYNIFFITSRPLSVKDNTEKWMNEIFKGINFKLLFSGGVFGKSKTKSEICREKGIKIMIEDSAEYAIECARNGIKTFLLDKPWNQNYERHENIIKVKDWEEVVEHLN